MPPKKLPPKTPQQKPQSQNVPKDQPKKPTAAAGDKPAVPEREVKKSSSISAQLALEATKKAYELRQAAYGAGDPNAREEILAKAINKEIEAESFGKAAKYTRSGAFQGLAAGAGLGVQPGVTLGKLTGALVGGLVSSVGALIGGGIGSAYGAISGPFWDLGQIASHGVRSIVGDFPNWEATSSQKKALERMVMGAQQTKAPDQQELEQMRDDDGGVSQEDYQQFARDLTSWIPNMPSLPSMPAMPSMPSIPGLGRRSGGVDRAPAETKITTAVKPDHSQQSQTQSKPKPPSKPPIQATQSPPQQPQNEKTATPTAQPQQQQPQKEEEKVVKKKPRKLENRPNTTPSQPDQAPVRRAPPKLEVRNKTVTANVSQAA